MSDNNNNNSSSGVGFCGLLTLIFITLKLLNVIHWSWIWVLAPSWIPLLIGIIFLVIWLVLMLMK